MQSGRIITAAGVSAGIDLALFVVGELLGRERAERIQLMIEYDPQPPYHAGHPERASGAVHAAAREEMLERARNPRNAISVPVILWRRAVNRLRARVGLARPGAHGGRRE